MSKKNSVTLPVDAATTADLSLVLASLPAAVKGLETMVTARETARAKCLAFADSVKATFGSLRVLTATARNKEATDAEKAAYTQLKEATLAEIWGAEFLAWVNGAGADKPRAPKRGQKAQPRSYWQQQKGAKWNKAGEGFVPRVLGFVAESEATTTERAPKTPTGLADACIKNVNAAHKRLASAIDKGGNDLPPHVASDAFLVLTELAVMALEKSKAKRDKAERALAALKAAKVIM